MAILPILQGATNPILRRKTEEVTKVTKDITKFLKDMEATAEASEGLGIAAPQVGKSMRIFLAKVGGRFRPFINPSITWRSSEQESAIEGCLSLPGVEVDVPRAKAVIIRFFDSKGRAQERKLEHLEARIVQHELDHLDGVLIIDYQKSF